MEEHCKNPWNKRCTNTNIVLYIEHKHENKPICAVCWIKIARNTKEWGEGDMRPPFNAKVITDETGMAVYGKLRREDKKPGDKFYTWKENERLCSRCKIVKPIDEFYIKKSGIVNAWCKQCSKEYCRERRIKKLYPQQTVVDCLLDKVVTALGFKWKGYRVVVSGQLKWALGNAHIWEMFNVGNKDRIIKMAVRRSIGKESEIISTIIHEVAHFEHLEKVMLDEGIKSARAYLAYMKRCSDAKSWSQCVHNAEFCAMKDELIEAYERNTAAG